MAKFVIVVRRTHFVGYVVEAQDADKAARKFEYNRAAYKMFQDNARRICDKPDEIVKVVSEDDQDGLVEHLAFS